MEILQLEPLTYDDSPMIWSCGVFLIIESQGLDFQESLRLLCPVCEAVHLTFVISDQGTVKIQYAP